MKHTFVYLLLFLFLCHQGVQATVEVRSRHLTAESGIANNTIRSIYQDSKGFIWLGTLNGLNRYDGHSFLTFRPKEGDTLSLPDHRIFNVEEDSHGLLWISTESDIQACYSLQQDRFVDYTGCGEHHQHYKQRMEDSQGHIWLWQNGNGMRRITYADGQFSSMVFRKEKGNLETNSVENLVEDGQRRIWVGFSRGIGRVEGDRVVMLESTQDVYRLLPDGKEGMFSVSKSGELMCWEEATGTFTVCHRLNAQVSGDFRWGDKWLIFTREGGFEWNLKTRRLERSQLLDVPFGRVGHDGKGHYWVSNHTGRLWLADTGQDKVVSFQLMPPEKVKFIDEERYHALVDARGILWISTYGNGLFAYDGQTGELQHFEAEKDEALMTDFLQNILEDRDGGIWVSSEFTGLTHLTVINQGITRILPEPESFSDRANMIRMLQRRADGKICIGTRRGGCYLYAPDLSHRVAERQFPVNIYAMAEGADGSEWWGSRGNGLCIDGRWYTEGTDEHSLGSNQVFELYRDRKGRMWIATFGGGLNLAVPSAEGYVFRQFLRHSNNQQQVRSILEDTDGWMWVGTSAGLCVFRPDDLIEHPDHFICYDYAGGDLPGDVVKCILQDSKGRVWLATSGTGFSCCIPDGDYRHLRFRHYGVEDGLVNCMVQSIVEDRDGCLWLSTEYGISRFSPETETFENFFFSPYALGNYYGDNSGCLTADGKVVFGSGHGVVVITPQATANELVAPPVVSLTSLLVDGGVVHPSDEDSPLERSLAYTDALRLKHYQNTLTVDFSTFDYENTHAVKYTYRLDPYDKDWSQPSSLNFASYKNLSPGTYKLRVKACNAYGVWGTQETMLKLTVLPPWWKTGWAYLIYIVLVAVALYVTWCLVRNFTALRNRIQIEKQLTEYKLVFFTNISHEFRTPLTLIQGALEKIHRFEKLPREVGPSLKVMDKSTQRMLRLINQLLEFRKMQNGKLALSLEETDIIAFLYEIFLSFQDAAASKTMDFRFQPTCPSYKMFIDKGHVDKMVYNLLSNAFKYTPCRGMVVLAIEVDEARRQLVIRVSDTGVGIPKEKQGELFNRFMQSSFSGSSVGVGLHLTHELVNVHHGSISFCENAGGGSVFTITLPTDRMVYEEKDFLIPHNVLLEEEKRHHEEVLAAETARLTTDEDEPDISMQPLNGRKVLVIEDDNDVRDFVREELSRYFEVEVAADGNSGLEKAKTFDADLIVCDILMPGMNGYEVTRKLKNDFTTSHIPVILLTAMNSPESHLQGVESGADAYITKPFSTKFLLTRVFKLIEQREKLREKFSNSPTMLPPAICTTDKDKEFADRLQAVLEEQLDNPQFSIDEFAAAVGLGRTVFYRKVRGVTGYSPNEYVRIVRLKKAALLLLEGRLTVSEVSYQVGINDPFYFSKCFKQQFGVSPSVYSKQKGVIPEQQGPVQNESSH